MWTGKVEAIFIAAQEGEPVTARQSVRAVPRRGLEGDRYFQISEKEQEEFAPKRELTLIEAEAIESFKATYEVEFSLGDSRRNIVTRGVPLNHLINREFSIGNVRVRGLELCEPCSYLGGLTTKKVLPGLIHRAGLRAQILSEGVISVGDEMRE